MPLPAAIAAIQPEEVLFESPTVVRGPHFATNFFVVHIKLFGLHRTGSDAIPYFGLEYVSGANASDYVPEPGEGASGNGYDSFRKITDRIYEVCGPR